MEKWSVEQANKWYTDKKWIVGCNYVPATAVNSTEMWQSGSFDRETISKELRLAKESGFNSCRVFLQYILWESEREKMLENFETFLTIAKLNEITVMPILFDDCAFDNRDPYLGKQDDPVPGVHNSRWTPSPGMANADNLEIYPKLEQYVKEIISLYKEDERIIVWDLYNEPGNSERGEKSWILLEKVFEWARACEPSQPLTAGVWCFSEFDRKCAELSDVISFHSYLSYDKTLAQIESLKVYNRPLFCTEWLFREGENKIETHMPLFKENKVGIYNWGLVKGKTQTNLSWATMQGHPNPNPIVWQHDLFDENHKPYSQEEIDFIKKIVRV